MRAARAKWVGDASPMPERTTADCAPKGHFMVQVLDTPDSLDVLSRPVAKNDSGLLPVNLTPPRDDIQQSVLLSNVETVRSS